MNSHSDEDGIHFLQPEDEQSVPSPERYTGQTVDSDRGRVFPCLNCGADLLFHIGTQNLKCRNCGAERTIVLEPEAAVIEQDFHDGMEKLQTLKETAAPEHQEIRCGSCGGTVLFEGTLTSSTCPYCGSPIQRENVHRGGFRIPVDGVLPFQIDEQVARKSLADWVSSRWFAPNDFKHAGQDDRFNGVYFPFFTFDSLTYTVYKGQRGKHYYVTVGSGKNQQRQRRTSWSPASGDFQKFFDDLLVNATRGLPVTDINNLAPWRMSQLQPFDSQFLAGFFARTYDVDLDQAFEIARSRMDQMLEAETRSRIGGDEQRISQLNTRFDAITFKHLLLPIWLLAYRYRGRSFQVFVNATTGEVQGARPYSPWKISAAVIAGLLAALVVLYLTQR